MKPEDATARRGHRAKAPLRLLGAMTAVLIAVAGPEIGAAAAEGRSTEVEFLGSLLRVEDREIGQGQTIRSFLACLRRFHAGAPRPVRIAQPSGGVFRVEAELASDTTFQFQLIDVGGTPVAVLRRVEYKVEHGYTNITDSRSKRLIVASVCRSDFPPTLDGQRVN